MSAGKVVVVSDGEFEQPVLKSEIPVMLDFWAEWCQPCKMLAPTVEELAGEFDGQILVGKLNVDDNPNTATNYGIRGIPTLLFIKNGQLVQQLVRSGKERRACSLKLRQSLRRMVRKYFPTQTTVRLSAM